MRNEWIFDFIAIFPELIEPFLKVGPLKKVIDAGTLKVRLFDLKKIAENPKQIDDYPFGGGPGMVLKPEPIKKALEKTGGGYVIYFSPQGLRFDQSLAHRLIEKRHLVFICGRYKGIDERIVDKYVDMELSIGDYVLSAGEIAGIVTLDVLSRLLPDAMGNVDSAKSDSFESNLLDAPYYTRPRIFEGEKVPEVLLSGNHKLIEKWRRKEALKRTLLKRPDLLENIDLSPEDRRLLEEIIKEVLAHEGPHNKAD
jgi:tRNA (guanine37-N1)-methyltransferase